MNSLMQRKKKSPEGIFRLLSSATTFHSRPPPPKKQLPFEADLILTANVGRGLGQSAYDRRWRAAFSRFCLTVLEDLIFYWCEGPPQAPHIQVSRRSSKLNEGPAVSQATPSDYGCFGSLFVCTADKGLICRSPQPPKLRRLLLLAWLIRRGGRAR